MHGSLMLYLFAGPFAFGGLPVARPPKAKGPANRYIMRLPCMVNSSL